MSQVAAFRQLVAMTKAKAADVMYNFNLLRNVLNGNVDSTNLKNEALLNATKHGDLGTGAYKHDADEIYIADVGDYYAGDEVEAALQEVGVIVGSITNIWTGTKTSAEFTTDATGHTKITVTLADHSIPEQSDTGYFVILSAWESGSTSAGYTPAADEKFSGYDYIRHMIPLIVNQKITTTTFDVRFTDIANNQFTGKCKFDFIIIRNT